MAKRLLFVGLHRPGRSPSQRFRFEQFQPVLEGDGWLIDYAHVLDADGDRVLYSEGSLYSKVNVLAKGWLTRFKDIARAKDYDVIFIQREAFIFGSTFFERRFARSGAAIVYDFDDAIWKLDVSDANKKFGWLKGTNKTSKLIGLADLVLAGNGYLADYARAYNNNVLVLPTVIDTDYFKPHPSENTEQITIGWTGSQTTVKHLNLAMPVLKELKEKYADKIRVLVIGERPPSENGIEIEYIRWNQEAEVDQLNQIDIGIMPLPDDEWARGKCGFKGIQYMSVGKPTIMSAVGVNPEIIEHGENGYLIYSDHEWSERLTALIEDEKLRTQFGMAGRKTIEERYSVNAVKGLLLSKLNGLV